MSSKQLRGDINYAWPDAEIAVMGAKGAVEVLNARELRKLEKEEASKELERLEGEYAEKFLSPWCAAKRGYIDDVIRPSRTRVRIIKALLLLQNKQDSNPVKKHGNMPL